MKALDFNAIQQPTWLVKLKDGTEVSLEAPSVELVERLTAMAPDLSKAAKNKDGRAIRASYQVVAEVMSCNADGFTFTADELRDKYRMTFMDLLTLVNGYLEFLAEIKDAKN
jgi:hypothetical protein